ncbi:HNH endonuclease family protein, partial [Avibacterium paragallinarum]|nr:HNH endonuclease family protein [Avibacterium paragallinarum]
LEQLAYEYYKDDNRQELLKKGGLAIPHYIFNYVDYLLWKDWDNRGKDNKFLKKNEFVFSLSRNSIEHYFPQSRRESLSESDQDNLDSLGNLCLISHYQNSSLNNEVPSEKRKRYESGSLKCISPKQALMLSYEIWGKEEIEKHNEDMIEILNSETKKYINNIS